MIDQMRPITCCVIVLGNFLRCYPAVQREVVGSICCAHRLRLAL